MKEMIGKTIAKVRKVHHHRKFMENTFTDDTCIDITMTDGSVYRFTSYCDAYTGNSYDEYPQHVKIKRRK